jgi:DnaD/phage-associated family protein
MTSAFAGFPAGSVQSTPIPDLVFSAILPAVADPAEALVTLYMFWFLSRQRGYPRYMTAHEIEGESTLLAALGAGGDRDAADPRAALARGIALAVARGTMLELTVDAEAGPVRYLFLNTDKGRQAVAAVRAGELVLDAEGPVREARPPDTRPTVFALYEQNIGLLQPLLVDELEQAARDYPPEWIEDAFREAAGNNARSWRYVQAILQRWAADGRGAGGSRRLRSPR